MYFSRIRSYRCRWDFESGQLRRTRMYSWYMYPDRKKYGRTSRNAIPYSIASWFPALIRLRALSVPPGKAKDSYWSWNSVQAALHSANCFGPLSRYGRVSKICFRNLTISAALFWTNCLVFITNATKCFGCWKLNKKPPTLAFKDWPRLFGNLGKHDWWQSIFRILEITAGIDVDFWSSGVSGTVSVTLITKDQFRPKLRTFFVPNLVVKIRRAFGDVLPDKDLEQMVRPIVSGQAKYLVVYCGWWNSKVRFRHFSLDSNVGLFSFSHWPSLSDRFGIGRGVFWESFSLAGQ